MLMMLTCIFCGACPTGGARRACLTAGTHPTGGSGAQATGGGGAHPSACACRKFIKGSFY